ncbi:MAG: FAD-binding protein [Bacteroidales bacterium]|nr:FAD-binding protein [Bacteroidales bacterium]
MISSHDLLILKAKIDGEIFTDNARLIMYSTDASAYRERPMAVVYPKNENDIRELVRFAGEKRVTLIPRAAGTSLAGQVVGNGIVMDISRYMTAILEINQEERWVRVQPGVIPDELNLVLKPSGLFFSPETSTSNRCMIGGMIGNNASGLHSLIYGTTREHLISVRAVLSDASVAEFGPVNRQQFNGKCHGDSFENHIYRETDRLLKDPLNAEKILSGYPDPNIIRRNTGYALDELLNSSQYLGSKAKFNDFNMCRLLAGSEGTLAFITEAKLHLDLLPPENKLMVPVHCHNVAEAIRGNLIALRHIPSAVELMDKTILDCTKQNISQRRNRFFLQGDPGAILMVEFTGDSPEDIKNAAQAMQREMESAGIGFHFPQIVGEDIKKVWALRKAGLGVLSNLPGEGRPVSVIEDTSVAVEVLEDYINDFNKILEKYRLSCVYHAHISVGELHLRPILNLRQQEDVELFHHIALETAKLVRKYRGSFSGEHGDGRLRGEFIPLILGEHNFNLIKKIKNLWDPHRIFNAGKITDSPPMNSFLRYNQADRLSGIETYFNYDKEGGLVSLIEKCNGSGDCRKTERLGGTMCPSYMASRDESNTTRARANILREMMFTSERNDPFDHQEIYDVLDLCLSCKACKSECPSNVDMAKLKAEFLQHWYEIHGIPFRTRLIAYITRINKLGSIVPFVFNLFASNRFLSGMLKRIIGFADKRSIPALHPFTLRKWIGRHLPALNGQLGKDAPEALLYIDEFTNYNDVRIGITAIRLLNRLGVRIAVIRHAESARSFISKGLLKQAKKIVDKNVRILSGEVNENRVLIGIEPSAILGFRDEIPVLVRKDLREKALNLSRNSFTIEEYICRMVENGKVSSDLFTTEHKSVRLHGHCQQKAIASTSATLKILSLPVNYRIEEIPSGCCGMAGSFGYEKEHYDLSIKVGELVLFPAIRETPPDTIIAAPGTSCRQQINDGTGRKALHPVEVLYNALK